MVQPWLIARLNPRRDERRRERAAAGFDSDASRPDKQTPRRINDEVQPELIFPDKRTRRRWGEEWGGKGGRDKTIKNERFVVPSEDEELDC